MTSFLKGDEKKRRKGNPPKNEYDNKYIFLWYITSESGKKYHPPHHFRVRFEWSPSKKLDIAYFSTEIIKILILEYQNA